MNCKENNHTQTLLLNQISAEFTDHVLPVTIIVSAEIVVGFFSNLLILYVFIFRYHSCNFRTFVICLSSIDIVCTLTTMPGELVTQINWYNYRFPVVCKTKDFFNVSTVFGETLCLLVIAIDRYRKVCYPLEWQIKPKMAVLACVIIIVISSIVAVPVTIFWGIMCAEMIVGNTTVTVHHCEKDEKYKHLPEPFVYQAVVGSFVLVFLLAMFIIYLRVARALIRQKHDAILQAPVKPRTRKKALFMIVLSACFMVTTFIYYVMLCILGATEDILEDLSNDNRVVFFFFLRFYFIQHLINPILCAIMDPNVKEALSHRKVRATDSISSS